MSGSLDIEVMKLSVQEDYVCDGQDARGPCRGSFTIMTNPRIHPGVYSPATGDGVRGFVMAKLINNPPMNEWVCMNSIVKAGTNLMFAPLTVRIILWQTASQNFWGNSCQVTGVTPIFDLPSGFSI